MNINKEKVAFTFDRGNRVTIKFLRYYDIGVSGYWTLHKPYCNSKSVAVVYIQKREDIYCFLWCILAHSQELELPCGRVTLFETFLPTAK